MLPGPIATEIWDQPDNVPALFDVDMVPAADCAAGIADAIAGDGFEYYVPPVFPGGIDAKAIAVGKTENCDQYLRGMADFARRPPRDRGTHDGGVMTDDGKIEVRDNRDRFRYEIVVDGVVGGFLQYPVRGGRMVLSHTEVPDANAGQGLATNSCAARSTTSGNGALHRARVPLRRTVRRAASHYDDLVDHEMFDTLNRAPGKKA